MKIFRFAVALATVVLFFFLLNLGKDLLIPFVYALFIWYLVNILSFAFSTVRIRGFQVPKAISFLFSVVTILGTCSVVVRIISSNIATIATGSLVYREKLGSMVGRFFRMAGLEEPESIRATLGAIDLGSLTRDLAGALTSLAGSGGLILIYLLFLFLEQKSFSVKIRELAKEPEDHANVYRLIRRIQSDVRLYLGIKTLTSVLTGVLSYFVMASVNLPFASFWALLIFLLNYIPSIGSIIATLFPSILALMQFEFAAEFWVVAVGVGTLQFLIGNILEPRLMGNSLNLSPLVILFSLTFWGSLWGIPGAFLCVPITVILMIVLSHFPSTQPVAIMMSRDGKVTKS